MELISLIAASIAAAFIGFNVLYLIIGRFDDLYFSETVFISYALGLGLISLEMLIFYFFDLKFSIPNILLPWTLLLALNVFRYWKSGNKLIFIKQLSEAPVVIARAKPEAISFLGLLRQPMRVLRLPLNDARVPLFLNMFLVFGITLETVYAFFRALIKPIEAYDAVAIYAIKSKIFFLAKSIPQSYFTNLIYGFPHPDYPLNIPLTETFMYLAMRSLNDQLVKIIFPLFFLGILCVLYFAIRRFASRTYALLFTFLLASIPQCNAYAANAYQELPLAFYYFVSAIFLFTWIENRSDLRTLTISAMMVALAAWTKNEGLLYCVINTVFVLSYSILSRRGSSQKSIYAPIMYIGIIALMLAPWIWLKHTYGIVNSEINLLNLNPIYLSKQFHKLVPILYELQKQLFGPKKWNIFWLIVIFVSLLNYKKLFSGTQKYISISVILALCGYVLFYMISYVDVVFFTSKTWGRFMLHFLPLLVLWLAYILKEDVKI